MYKVGDKVIHQREGACYITQTTNMGMENIQKEYFVLEPILDEKSNIYISVDQKKQDSIRPVINRKELKESEDKLKLSDSEWIIDAKARYHMFMNTVSSFDFEKVLDVYKCLVIQNEKKPLNAKDKDFLISSEKLIGSEIAIVLEQKYEHVIERIKEHVLN